MFSIWNYYDSLVYFPDPDVDIHGQLRKVEIIREHFKKNDDKKL